MNEKKQEKPQKIKKGLLLVCCVLLVLIVVTGCVAIWQKNNLEALMQYNQYTKEELEQQLQDNDKKVQDILNAALEEAKKIDSENSGSSTSEAVEPPADLPKEPADSETENSEQEQSGALAQTTPVQTQTPAGTTVPPASEKPSVPETPVVIEPVPEAPVVQETPAVPTGPTYEEQLQVIVDKVYALRAEYLKALDDLQAEAVAEYKAIPKASRTKKAIINFVSKYISKATGLEKQCDGKMDELVKELTQLQKKYGQSLELVDAVKYTYANEKSLKKAWYMSELERRGMI